MCFRLIPGVTLETDSCEFGPPSRLTKTRTGSRTCRDWEKLITSVGIVFELESEISSGPSQGEIYSQDTCLAFNGADRNCGICRAVSSTETRWGGERRLAGRVEGRSLARVERTSHAESTARGEGLSRRHHTAVTATRCWQELGDAEDVFVKVPGLSRDEQVLPSVRSDWSHNELIHFVELR